MGLYSNNRTSLSDVEIPALEGYNGNVGVATAMLEAAQDDLKFFDMIIARDFQEAEMNAAGYTNESEEMTVVTEGVLQSAWGRIVEFFKKLAGKVKAIFSSVLAKINGTIIRDNKKLVEKYRKAVLAKNLKDMKYKWAEPTGKSIDVDAITSEYNKAVAEVKSLSGHTSDEAGAETVNKKVNDILDDNAFLEALYSAALGGKKVEAGEFAKEVKEYCFKDVEDMDEGAQSKLTTVMSDLINSKKQLSDLENKQKTIIKSCNEEVKKAQKAADEASKNVPDKEGKVAAGARVKLAEANGVHRLAIVYQTALLAACREAVNMAKFEIAQNRAFFTKAAAYNPKANNESADLFDAIDEAVEFDVESAFADYAVAE